MKIGIIGFGRFGQLLAKILKNKHQIKVFDSRKQLKTKAKELGVIFANLDNVCQQELIILAVPISAIKNVLEIIKNKVPTASIVMDVCSVKEYPADLMSKLLPKNTQIIASHPMFGPDSAKYGLKGLQMVFWPVRIKQQNYNRVKKIFSALGLKIIQMTPEKHDRESAFALALVHFIGRGLEQMIKIKPQQITTLGFERLLKVCETVTNDTWQLFKDMQTYNKFAKPLRKKFIKLMEMIDKKLK